MEFYCVSRVLKLKQIYRDCNFMPDLAVKSTPVTSGENLYVGWALFFVKLKEKCSET